MQLEIYKAIMNNHWKEKAQHLCTKIAMCLRFNGRMPFAPCYILCLGVKPQADKTIFLRNYD